jgi:hypothetical protein
MLAPISLGSSYPTVLYYEVEVLQVGTRAGNAIGMILKGYSPSGHMAGT